MALLSFRITPGCYASSDPKLSPWSDSLHALHLPSMQWYKVPPRLFRLVLLLPSFSPSYPPLTLPFTFHPPFPSSPPRHLPSRPFPLPPPSPVPSPFLPSPLTCPDFFPPTLSVPLQSLLFAPISAPDPDLHFSPDPLPPSSHLPIPSPRSPFPTSRVSLPQLDTTGSRPSARYGHACTLLDLSQTHAACCKVQCGWKAPLVAGEEAFLSVIACDAR